MLGVFINTFIKFFFLLTPFFLLSTFLSMTKEMDGSKKRKIAIKSTVSIIAVCLVLFFIGNQIFAVFGITLDSFRIGTGILLLISAATLVLGPKGEQVQGQSDDIAVVPLAIPVAVGPATTGALLVMGGELSRAADIAVAIAAIVTAVVCVGFFLFASGFIERVVKKQGLTILSKVTGLILAALASQMIMTGVMGFLNRD
ncbi:MAG TPA: MarC family protein [Spirochaetota bacterium]|nr:MarC family protein [Spirochaetota bacterium]HOD13653.1 MarC family protein [Spirochaetota bacterium]HPG50794.1 MarC family protein [Spirochaetota bacterium]HPN12711.1 MarC family protein [Spirochaetota bacterium]HQL81328.1 MarC family protein [Spirochaetota bacterium]